MHANEPEMAKKWEKKKKKEEESVEEAKKRDYKAEYKKFQSSTKAKKYRAELNKYNRQKGTYGNGDKKDASHKGGKIVGFEEQSKNRGRKEKSRLKKEQKITEDYKNSEWEVYVKDEKGKEKIVKKAKSKRAATILYNKIIKSDDYYEVGMKVVKEEKLTSEQKLREEIRKIIREGFGDKFGKMMNSYDTKIVKNALSMAKQQATDDKQKGSKQTPKLIAIKTINRMKEYRNKIKAPNLKKEFQKAIDKLEKDYKKIKEGKLTEKVQWKKDKKIKGKWYTNQGTHKHQAKANVIAGREWRMGRSDTHDTIVVKEPKGYTIYVRPLKEGKLIEGKGVEKVLNMAKDSSFGKLAGKTVDGMSANLFKQVYEKTNDKTREKINSMSEKQLYIFMTKLWTKFGKQVKI
jgi:hypothetical protein